MPSPPTRTVLGSPSINSGVVPPTPWTSSSSASGGRPPPADGVEVACGVDMVGGVDVVET
ncbi:hypothetical protein GCM10012280_55240 [Wenjunlia tyrosinilytica]|uniref:Uncharacterized protein n=1 Tax=Wenjunlia tyrosinilytica TaxID=1544741 RepID=A0A917ZWP4_9ACTN|nr:hypothetical protein GCM10012280_55240 [Wenjunlia tyrosinilytica]